ncbi:MAG TPA: hypothetical protein VL326_30050 [Kofleriaceae bacterium]|nr:hypothetical protein [Kofleriaceae bacterium]
MRIWARPGVQLAVGAAVVAVAFPATAAGSVALLLASALAGIGILRVWPDLPARVREPGRLGTLAVYLLIVAAGVSVFGGALTTSPDWQMGDWGPQHAVLARIMPSLPGFDVPVWNHAVSSGDAPLELYPAFTYILTGHVAIALGLEHDLPRAFMIVAVVTHISLALLTAAIAMRVSSRKIALALGLMFLLDSGAISHGGTVGLFHWAILHSAVAHVFSLIAVLGVLGALRRPRLGASVAIWLGTALACAAHPSALLMTATAMLALLGVAALATDIPPRRALVAIAHLALGLALGAIVWLPASERLLAYGQHFANELFTTVQLLHALMTFAMPVTAFSLVIYAGYLGMIVGLFSRRADVIFISVVAFALLLGLCDLPYLGFGLVPGQQTARLGAMRLMLLARPFLFAAGAFTVSLLGAHLRERWRSASPRTLTTFAALAGILVGCSIRVLPGYWRNEADRAYEETRVVAPDPAGRKQLLAWAREQAAQLTPDHFARAIFAEPTHEQMHITALTGLPTLHLGPIPDLLLRERVISSKPDSLARFNVRWVISLGRSPTIGDSATEKVFGTYHVRELAAWDGKFARIESGSGDVIVRRLDDRVVEVELTGTTQPALVALGTGYYPRWRATHEDGKAEPVYALPIGNSSPTQFSQGFEEWRPAPVSPTEPNEKSGPTSISPDDDGLGSGSDPDSMADGPVRPTTWSEAAPSPHVVSAWIRPGRTRFTVDGPLPSDGDGRGYALVAFIVIIGGIAITWRARWRVCVLRRVAIGLRKLRAYRRDGLGVGERRIAWIRIVAPLVVIALLAKGCATSQRPADAFVIGSGVRGVATVEARVTNGRWVPCGYVRVRGEYDCEGLVTVTDATANLVSDAPPSWPFISPAVQASAYGPHIEVRIRRTVRLAGRYWAGSSHPVTLSVGDRAQALEPHATATLDLADRDHDVVWEGAVPYPEALHVTLVKIDAIDPPRPYLVPPPQQPPYH